MVKLDVRQLRSPKKNMVAYWATSIAVAGMSNFNVSLSFIVHHSKKGQRVDEMATPHDCLLILSQLWLQL